MSEAVQSGLSNDRAKDAFEELRRDRIADLFSLHERAPIFYGLSEIPSSENDDSDASTDSSSLDTCKLPYTSSEDSGTERGSDTIPIPIYDVFESIEDPERFDKCMELLKRGEVGHARRLATCQKRSVELECPSPAGGCDESHYRTVTCGSRLCPECGDRRMGQLIGQYEDRVLSWENPAMLTLTVENTDAPVQKKDELTDDFARFRRRVVPVEGGDGEQRWTWKQDGGTPTKYRWKQYLCAEGNHDLARHLQKRYVEQGRGIPMKELLRGGFYGVDIKQQRDGSYNVHLHVLCDLAYTPQPALSEVWNDVAGAPVLDVRRCYGRGETARTDALVEVIGYASKPPEFDDVGDAVEVVTGLKGSCVVQPFGTLYGNVERATELVCPKCGTKPAWWNYRGYVDRAFEGEPGASVEGDDTRGENSPPVE